MGCGASSLGADQNRDDLAPTPHHQTEIRKTSNFTRSNSSGAIGDDKLPNIIYSNSNHEYGLDADRADHNAHHHAGGKHKSHQKQKKPFDLPVHPEMLSAMNRIKAEEKKTPEQRDMTNRELRAKGQERMKGRKGRYAGGMEVSTSSHVSM